MTKQRMTEFFDRLKGPEGCNFREENGKPAWNCAGGNSQELARKVLAAMGVAAEEAERFLIECKGAGGYCDCELVFNARGRMVMEAMEQVEDEGG